jgi:hypothetical protein
LELESSSDLNSIIELETDADTAGANADTAQANTPRSNKRLLANEFKKERQINQAKKMKARRDKATEDKGVGPGVIVRVGKNDCRDIPDACSSIGVVFDMKETGGIVCVQQFSRHFLSTVSDLYIPISSLSL